MTKTAFTLASLAALTCFGIGPSHADPYRWCAVYSGDASGGSNCGFITLQQCRDTVSGIGGSCEPNQFYTGPDRSEARPKPQHKRESYR